MKQKQQNRNLYIYKPGKRNIGNIQNISSEGIAAKQRESMSHAEELTGDVAAPYGAIVSTVGAEPLAVIGKPDGRRVVGPWHGRRANLPPCCT